MAQHSCSTGDGLPMADRDEAVHLDPPKPRSDGGRRPPGSADGKLCWSSLLESDLAKAAGERTQDRPGEVVAA
jgi:hypothetical protein